MTTAVGVPKQLFKSKKKSFEKTGNTKRFFMNQNNATVVKTLLLALYHFNDKRNALIIESTIQYVITTKGS